MSLATRCTACGTVFRVVQDQLKVSEGWVRCGRCNEVFDAREQLFDLERETPPPWPRPIEPQGQALVEALDDDVFEPEHKDAEQADVSLPSWQQPAEEAQEMRAPQESSVASSVLGESEADAPSSDEYSASSQWLSPPQAPPASVHFSPDSERHAADAQTRESMPVDIDGLAADPDDSPHSTPSFMRKAAKVRPPSSPTQRRLWTGVGLALALTLTGQALFHYRDTVAALDPQAHTYLKQLCQLLSCEIRPLQRIDALSVEGSSFTPVPAQIQQYRLAVLLRNRADSALALPSFELSLTDSGGALLARRVLGPADFAASAPASGNPAGTIAAKSELSLQTTLRSNDARLVGYTVEVFYP